MEAVGEAVSPELHMPHHSFPQFSLPFKLCPASAGVTIKCTYWRFQNVLDSPKSSTISAPRCEAPQSLRVTSLSSPEIHAR